MRKECEELWAKNKYLVLSKSQKTYQSIREYLKEDSVDPKVVLRQISEAKSLPENRGQVVNAFQHIWGYFKKKASADEKDQFMTALENYHSGLIPQADLIGQVQELLKKYPNEYLKQSTLLEEES